MAAVAMGSAPASISSSAALRLPPCEAARMSASPSSSRRGGSTLRQKRRSDVDPVSARARSTSLVQPERRTSFS